VGGVDGLGTRPLLDGSRLRPPTGRLADRLAGAGAA
jgi:hypothetical protein